VSASAVRELREKFGTSVDEGILVALGAGQATQSTPALSADAGATDDLSSYPNPFNPSTRIEYRVKTDGMVSLKVYDIIGREVAVLVNELKEPGVYSVAWDASRLPSGIYFTRLESAGKTIVRKLMLVK
jgi:hypothetical protein